MDQIELSENGRNFLNELFEQTHGDSSAQLSMYDIGSNLGMDKETAQRVAEELMGTGLIEIRTLAGGIAITEEGALVCSSDTFSEETAGPTLGADPIIGEETKKGMEPILLDIKNAAGNLGLDFDSLTELMADLKTVDAQLASAKPKTAIIRECCRSVKGVLEKAGTPEVLAHIRRLLGE
ncbi:hypothetical protein ACFL9U_16355 [Thermodesulfobacteriota bacterium]